VGKNATKRKSAAADCAIRQVRQSALAEEAEYNCGVALALGSATPQKCAACAVVETNNSTQAALSPIDQTVFLRRMFTFVG